MSSSESAYTYVFQSTLPVWGATVRGCGGELHGRISIHAPRVGSDLRGLVGGGGATHFNPRSPCGERLASEPIPIEVEPISIHAPRVGSDSLVPCARTTARYFNPRSPCGERPIGNANKATSAAFQSTLPVWGATAFVRLWLRPTRISIHAPRVGSDKKTGQPNILHIMISIHAPRVGSDSPNH